MTNEPQVRLPMPTPHVNEGKVSRPTQRSANAPTNTVKMLQQRAENGLQTPVQRPERPCACGCGACFVPKNNSQLYVSAQHRQRRFIEEKKDATFAFVQTLFRGQGQASMETASRIAHETVDFFFTARCKALERAGWKYNSEVRLWMYKGAA